MSWGMRKEETGKEPWVSIDSWVPMAIWVCAVLYVLRIGLSSSGASCFFLLDLWKGKYITVHSTRQSKSSYPCLGFYQSLICCEILQWCTEVFKLFPQAYAVHGACMSVGYTSHVWLEEADSSRITKQIEYILYIHKQTKCINLGGIFS